MELPRLLEARLLDKIAKDRRVVILYGPRQVGKTTLARKLLAESGLEGEPWRSILVLT